GTGGDGGTPQLQRVTVAGGEGQRGGELTRLGGGRHRSGPRRDVVDGGRARTLVAGRGGDEHPGRVGVEEGQLDRVGERAGTATDGEVDDVDAVLHRLGDRRGGVRGEAALRTAHPVH